MNDWKMSEDKENLWTFESENSIAVFFQEL
jgi:hypothetical protein